MYCIYIYIYIIKRLFTLPVIVYIMKNRSDMNQIQPDCWITILWRDSGFPHRFLLPETFFLVRQKNVSHRHSVSVCNRHLSAARATGLLAPVHTRLSLFIPLHLVLSDLFHCAWPETSSPHITSSLCGYNGGCENISPQQCLYRETSVQRYFYFVGRLLCLDPWLKCWSTWCTLMQFRLSYFWLLIYRSML